jgi:hypothetical protein
MNVDEEKLKKLQAQEKDNPNRQKIVKIMTLFQKNMSLFVSNPSESQAEVFLKKLDEIMHE